MQLHEATTDFDTSPETPGGQTLTKVPFVGFYETRISHDLSDSLEEQGVDDFPKAVIHHVCLAYTELFVEAMCKQEGLPELSLKMTKVWSPTEYNSATDEIDATISLSDFKLLLSKHCWEFRDYVVEKLKPRDGFMPYHSQELEDWGQPETWTPAQTELLLQMLSEDGDGYYSRQTSWEANKELYERAVEEGLKVK